MIILSNFTNSDNLRRKYCNLNVSTLGAVRYLGFDRKWIFTTLRHQTIRSAPVYQNNVNIIGYCTAELLMMIANYYRRFFVVFCVFQRRPTLTQRGVDRTRLNLGKT